jgi:excisionase family DNA binding protein
MKRRRITPIIDLEAAEVSAPLREHLFLTQEEACKRLGIGKATLKDWVQRGIIYAIPVGSRLKVPVAEIEKWREGRYARPDRIDSDPQV